MCLSSVRAAAMWFSFAACLCGYCDLALTEGLMERRLDDGSLTEGRHGPAAPCVPL